MPLEQLRALLLRSIELSDDPELDAGWQLGARPDTEPEPDAPQEFDGQPAAHRSSLARTSTLDQLIAALRRG